jgi:phosphoribosylformimino-5-aminoimidazole carboxamide ribotide isomerase
MYIIPAIDILDKKVVRLREGDYDQATFYDVTLEEMVEKYQSNGTEFVHIIDLNGAKGDFSNQEYLFEIIRKTEMKVQYGGGVRSIEKVKELIDSGVHRVIVGTQAITNPSFLEELSDEICGKDKCSDQVVVAIVVLD